MSDPDGQYEPRLFPERDPPILDGDADMVLGLAPGRAGHGAARAGCRCTSTWPTAPSRGSRTGSWERELSEMHTGYRAYSNRLLRRPVPAQRTRLQLRLRDAHAGGPLRLPDRARSPPAPATSTTRRRSACGRRSSTAPRRCGRRARPDPAPQRHPALEEVRAMTCHRRARLHARRAASTRPGSATSRPTGWRASAAAGRVLDLGCGVGHSLPRARAARERGLDPTPRPERAGPRDGGGRHARDPVPGQSFASVLSVQSLEHVPDPARAGRGGPRARAGGDGGLRDAQPADLRAARRDHRSLPLRRVRPGSCVPSAPRFAGWSCAGSSAPRLPRLVADEKASSTACSHGPAARCAGSFRAARASCSTTAACAANAST